MVSVAHSTRKSTRQATESPLSVRKSKLLSSQSVSKESTEDAMSKSKEKKETTVIQATMESKEAELDPEVVGMKRKNLSSRKPKALFKTQRVATDGGDALERSENLVGVCSDKDDLSSKQTTYSSPNEDKDFESSREVAEDTASEYLVCGYRDLEGTCLLCSKMKRVPYDLPEQELCPCSPMCEDLVGVADSSTNDDEELCGFCRKDGDLLTCEGQNCRNCYHLRCLDPPLNDALPGAWHCPQCVKKKLSLGVHSVSTGVESIWNVREVVIPNAGGVQQRQFLVKYHRLAHVHNHWVPETQLLLETPCLVSNFLEKDQDARWNAKWMVPHRLLWKRPIHDNIYVASTSVIWVCEYEWLVKWCDLDYDHATWELDNAKFLSSSIGQDLVRNYEVRRGKAKPEANKPHMEPIIGNSEIPVGSHETHVLEDVNKVGEFLLKCPNAVVIDDQERTTTAIHLIHSMIETFRSFLIIATHDSLSRWEANLERLAPSVNVVVYSGSRDTRNVIRASEFYDEGGCVAVQVLLSSVEAVLEDLEILKRIKWKAILIDEYQYSGIPNGLEQIKMLSTDMRVLLASSQIKDATSEYLKILSFVEPEGDFDKSEITDNLSELKERLSPFIVHVHTSQAPKFTEYVGYQCTEENVSSVYTKMRSLTKVCLADSEKKKVYLESSDNGTCLNRDGLSGEEDFSRGSSDVNYEELQCSSYIEIGAKLECGVSSANKEHVEGQILTKPKVARNDEAGATDIDEDDAMKIVQKKCDKRMQKLIQKQQKQIEEVERIWLDGRDKLETNYKLESSRIRSKHGETPAGMDKLKLLDVDLNNKINDLDILKDAQLKNLRADHFAAINEERQRATDWLNKMKSRSREVRVINGHQSHHTLPADDSGSPQPSTCIAVGGDGDKFPIPGNLENEIPSMSFSQQGNGVISSISSESALADARSDETPAENLESCTSVNEVRVGSLAELTQSENFIDDGLAVLTKLPVTAEQVSDENQWAISTEEHLLVHETVPSDIMGHDPSQEESNDVRKTSLSDDLVCRRSEPKVVTDSCMHSPGQPLLQTEQTMTLPDSYKMLPHDTDALHEENRSAPQIEIAMSEPTDSVTPVPVNFESLVTNDIVSPEASDKAPVELHDTDALHDENRSAPQIDIATSDSTDSATPEPLNFESPVTDVIVTPEASDKAPVELQDTDALHEESQSALQIEIAMSEPTDSVMPVPLNFESSVTDHIVSPEASDKAPVDEVFGQLHSLAVDISLRHDQLLATEHHDQERSSPQTAEPEGTEVVLHQSISQADENLELHAHRMSVVAGTSNQPNQAVMENDVAVPQAMVSISGQPNQAVLNSPVVCIDAGNLHGPNFFLNPTHQPIQSSALPSLTDPLQNEIERIDKETEQLEKSHVDMMAQLKSDCDKEIEKIIAQLRNKYEVKSRETDAEVRVKLHELDKNQNKVCLNIMLANAFRSRCSDARPSGLPSIQQGLSNPMLPPSVRPSPGPSASQPAPSPTSAPAAAHTLPTTSSAVQQLSRSHLMRSSPSAIRNVTAHPIQGLQRAAARISGNSARPPVISAITPANLRASSEIRSVLPHLRSCRSIVRASMSAPPSSSAPSQFQPFQILPKPPSQPGLLPRPPLVAQNIPPGFPDRHPYLSGNRNASVPDIPSTFRSVEQSDLERLGNASRRPVVQVEADVVCLSDDE